MKKLLLIVLVGAMVSFVAMGDTFPLARWGSSNNSDWGLIVWKSPGNGTVVIRGDETATYQTQTVWVDWASAAYVQTYGITPASTGQTTLYAGTTQCSGNYGQWPGCASVSGSLPAQFGSTTIPVNSYLSPPTTALNWNVAAGDVIVAAVQEMNIFSGDTANMNLNVAFSGDFSGAGPLNGQYSGIAGILKPSTGNSFNSYSFSWGGGDFSGNATTETVINGAVPGGFQSGMGMSLYAADGALVGSTTVLNSSSAYSLFDFGVQAAGDYTLRVTDLNPNDDPPYNIEFNNPINAPAGVSSVPEPGSFLLLATVLALAVSFRRRAG